MIEETTKTEEQKEIKQEETAEQQTEKKIEEKAPKKTKKKEDEQEEKIEIPAHLEKFVKEIEEMKLIDLSKLVKVLEKKFGVSAMSAAIPASASQPGTGKPEEEKKQIADVVLTNIGAKKIEVIKAIKEITQKGLKECKDLVDATDSEPQTIRGGVKREEAEEIKKKLETAGATVELK